MNDNSEKFSVATQTNGVDVKVLVAFWRDRAVDFEKQNEQLRKLVKDKNIQIKQLSEDKESLKTELDDIQSKYGKTFIFYFTFLFYTKFAVSI